MKTVELTFPEIGLMAVTRVMAGAGAALLLSDKLPEERKKIVGWTLFLIGALSTIPLAANALAKRKEASESEACYILK